ncbi:MAG: hypothetical protein JW969_18890 [Spirochaetales bacterium]|nr:hypothetical protein [Spirochaetales bacterium]
MEIMTWVPPYGRETCKISLQAGTGGVYNPANTLTRIGGQFWQIQPDGTTILQVPEKDVRWVADYCRSNGIKFLICVYNYIDGWNWQVASSAFIRNRASLVDHLADLVGRWGADGVDVDIEGTAGGNPDRREFAVFIQELGSRLHSMGKELTVDFFSYYWNQPNMNWIGDWKGFADGINTMGYEALFGGGAGWQAYRWQQDAAIAAGYVPGQFSMGMPSWLGEWGSGGLGIDIVSHINELLSGRYNRFPTSLCIWDAQFSGTGWLSAGVWNGLHKLKKLPSR